MVFRVGIWATHTLPHTHMSHLVLAPCCAPHRLCRAVGARVGALASPAASPLPTGSQGQAGPASCPFVGEAGVANSTKPTLPPYTRLRVSKSSAIRVVRMRFRGCVLTFL